MTSTLVRPGEPGRTIVRDYFSLSQMRSSFLAMSRNSQHSSQLLKIIATEDNTVTIAVEENIPMHHLMISCDGELCRRRKD
jgi:hypothetical protein